MTREAMCASRIAEPIAQPEITTPQTVVAARKRRSAVDARHSRGSRGPRLLLLRTLASPVAGGMRSAEIRCRKTQYVQPWYITVSGAISAVTQVMILRVYGVDEP